VVRSNQGKVKLSLDCKPSLTFHPGIIRYPLRRNNSPIFTFIPAPSRLIFNILYYKTPTSTRLFVNAHHKPNRRQASIATKSLLINEMINLKQSIIETARRKTRKWSELQPFW